LRDTLISSLPPVYKDLLSPELEKPAVKETRADCANCQMCNQGTMPAEAEAVYFRPDTKCCTYHPSLPNYLVGAILKDGAPDMQEGKRRIKERIASRIGVFPYSLAPPAKYLLLYDASRGFAFGRSAALKCPYLTDTGLCSVWRHRETICSTFYCKFDGGETGVAFWKTWKAYMQHVESSLAVWSSKAIARDLVNPPLEKTKLTVEELEDKPPKDSLYASWWGSWVGREEEYYVSCYSKVRNLSKRDFARMVDETPKGKSLLSELRTRYAALSTPFLPDRLALNARMRRLPIAAGTVITTTYNPYDSMLIEKELFEVLEKITHDKTVVEARKELEASDGIELADELLVHLVRHAVLVGPPTEATDQAKDGAKDRKKDEKKKKKKNG
jgi:hypothetical protein